jgi:hypothetical protein
MSSTDVVDLYNRVGVGAEVQVIRGGLTTTTEGQRYARSSSYQRPGFSSGG